MDRDNPEHGKPDQATPPEPLSELAERVLEYFEINPSAMDSAEGIAAFWVRAERAEVERALVELHARGRLDERTIGGVHFYSAPQPVHPHAQARPSASSERFPVAARPGNILVVDDDSVVRDMLCDALTAVGHAVTAARDGNEAIDKLRDTPFDLVVTDVVMPQAGGMVVLDAVKRLAPSVETIMVTAFADLDMALEALRRGAYDVIQKPIADLHVLHRTVERALERHRMTEETRLLVASLGRRNQQLKNAVDSLSAVTESLAATRGLITVQDTCQALVPLVAQHLRARRVSILVTDARGDAMTVVATVGAGDEAILHRKVPVGEGIAGRVAASGTPLLVKDIEASEFRALRNRDRYKTGSFVVSPLVGAPAAQSHGHPLGVISAADKHTGDPFDERDLDFLGMLAVHIAIAVERGHFVNETESGFLKTVVGLIAALEGRNKETLGHSRRVAGLAVAVARVLGLQEARIDLLRHAAELHEIGRLMAMPAEAGTKRRHATLAGRWSPGDALAAGQILAPIAPLKTVSEIVLHSADPPGPEAGALPPASAGVPPESRILAVCEAFDDLSAGATGRSEPARQALETLRRQTASPFDSDVVQALSRVLT